MGPGLIPILGIVVGIPGFVAFLAVVLRHDLKKKEMELRVRGGDPELGRVVDALRDDVDDTRGRLAEVEERLDYAVHMLTAGRASQDEKSK